MRKLHKNTIVLLFAMFTLAIGVYAAELLNNSSIEEDNILSIKENNLVVQKKELNNFFVQYQLSDCDEQLQALQMYEEKLEAFKKTSQSLNKSNASSAALIMEDPCSNPFASISADYTNISECGDNATFSFAATVNSNTDILVSFDVPANFAFEGSVTGGTLVTNGATVEIMPDITAGEIAFTFEFRALCGATDDEVFNFFFDYLDSDLEAQICMFTSLPLTVLDIAVTIPPEGTPGRNTENTVVSVLNENDTLTSTIVQEGVGVIDSLFFYVDDHSLMSIEKVMLCETEVELNLATKIGDRNYFWIDDAALGGDGFTTNEGVDVCVVWKTVMCPTGDIPPVITGATTSCELDPAIEICQNAEYNAAMDFGAKFPEIIQYIDETLAYDPTCIDGSPIKQRWILINEGTAPAGSINVRLTEFGGNTPIDFTSISYTVNGGAALTDAIITNTVTGFPACVNSYANSGDLAKRMNITFENIILKPNEELVFEYDVYPVPCGCGGCSVPRRLGTDISDFEVKDLCGTVTQNALIRTEVAWPNFDVDIASFMETPVTNCAGSISTMSITVTQYLNSYLNNEGFNAQDDDERNAVYTPCTDCYFSATFDLPNGLDYIPGTIEWIDNDGTVWTPDTEVYTDNDGGVDQLVVTWIGQEPSGFDAFNEASGIFFDFTPDCENELAKGPNCSPVLYNDVIDKTFSWSNGACPGCAEETVECTEGINVTIKCPGTMTDCTCDGFVHTNTEARRQNLYISDPNNDGLPDAGSAYNQSLLRTDRFLKGDSIRVDMGGYVSANDAFTNFDYIYAEVDFPDNQFIPLGGEMTIIAGGITYTCDVLTQQIIGTKLVTDLSIPSLTANGCTMPTSYFHTDSVALTFYYTPTDEFSGETQQLTQRTRIFASDQPYGGPEYSCRLPLDYRLTQVGTQSSFDYFNQRLNGFSGCAAGSPYYRGYSRIGSANLDFFPGEYINDVEFITHFESNIPAGMVFDEMRIYIRRKNASGTNNLGSVVHGGQYPNGGIFVDATDPSVTIVGNQLFFDFATFLTAQGINGGDYPDSDEGYSWSLMPYFIATCDLAEGPVEDATMMATHITNEDLLCSSGYQFEDTLTNLNYDGGAEIVVTAVDDCIDVDDFPTCARIRVQNTAPAVANNAWLSFYSASGSFSFASLTRITGGASDVIAGSQYNMFQLGDLTANANELYELCVYANACGEDILTVASGFDCVTAPSIVEEATCKSEATITYKPVRGSLGMAIKEPASDEVLGDLCDTVTYVLNFVAAGPGFLSDLYTDLNLPLDTEFVPGSFEMAYPADPSLTVIPPDADFDPIGDPSYLNGNTYRLDISGSNPILSTIGLIGSAGSAFNDNVVNIRFDIMTKCGFASGSRLFFEANAKEGCGEDLEPIQKDFSKLIAISDAPEPFVSEIGIEADTLNACAAEQTPITINYAINGNMTTSVDDSIRVILPAGLTFVPGSYIQGGNPTPDPPVVVNESGLNVAYWGIGGIDPGTDTNFGFSIQANDIGQECKDYLLTVQTFKSGIAYCDSTDEDCVVRSISDESQANIFIDKADLAITSASAVAMAMGDNEMITFTMEVENQGNLPTGSDAELIVDIYKDTNQDGRVNDGDQLIDFLTFDVNLAVGQSVIYTDDITMMAGMSCDLLAYIDISKNCSCKSAGSFSIEAKLDLKLPDDVYVCSNEAFQIGPISTSYTYDWISLDGSDLSALSPNLTTSPAIFQFDNNTGSTISWDYGLRITRGSSCYTFDTITVNIYPETFAEVSNTVCGPVADCGDPAYGFPLAGPSGGTNYNWDVTSGDMTAVIDDLMDPQSTVSSVITEPTRFTLSYDDENGCPAEFIQNISLLNCACTALGDTVWFDLNVDGIQDLTEMGIPGVTVYLYNATNLSTPIQSTMTDMNGHYLFAPLAAGNYVVSFDKTTHTSPYHILEPTIQDIGLDEDDSDADPITGFTGAYFVPNGISNLTVDAGFYPGFDLALSKEINTTLSPGPYLPGDIVSFDITVTNQGGYYEAQNVDVVDYIPTGLSYSGGTSGIISSLNNNVTTITNNGGGAFTIDKIAPLDAVTLTVEMQITATALGSSIVNYAEISDFENEYDLPDSDSTPDVNDSNDAGGNPNSSEDNHIDDDGMDTDGDGITDEDDHDPAQLDLPIVDIALIKTYDALYEPLPVPYGTLVKFDITVYNQGDFPLHDIVVQDYAPTGLNFNASTPQNISEGWTPGGTINIPGPLAPGANTTVSIYMTVLESPTSDYINAAEIISADDENGRDVAGFDIDSNPGSNTADENSVTPGSGGDNNFTSTGIGELGSEDDHDIAIVTVVFPVLSMEKNHVSSTWTGDNCYDLVYEIIVRNDGGDSGTYDLVDDPMFDDDFVINSAIYTTDAFGNPGGSLPAGSSTYILADDQTIAALGVDRYTITIAVCIDLEDASSPGNEVYTSSCFTANGGSDSSPGEGLHNTAKLDTDNDGNADVEDESCVDVPYLKLDKTSVSVTRLADGTYTIVYTIEVENIGGADGSYNLTDLPGFDNDISINTASFTSNTGLSNPSLATTVPSGGWVLATDQIIPPNESDLFTLTVNVDFDLFDGVTGDDTYTSCGSSSGGTATPGEGLYNQAVLDVDDDGMGDLTDETCEDLEVFDLALTKVVVTPGPYTYDQIVEYQICVFNQGTQDASDIEITDHSPCGLEYDHTLAANVANGWTAAATPTPMTIVSTSTNLLPGDQICANIYLKVVPCFTTDAYVNEAEISESNDGDGNPATDVDSTADDDADNDAGGDPNTSEDDHIDDDGMDSDGDGVEDEDDHDPALIVISDVLCSAINNGPVCSTGAIELNETGGEAVAWSWTGPGGFSSTDQSPTIATAVAGTYNVQVTDVDGNTKVCQTDVVVHPALEITGAVTDNACAFANTGAININVTGGFGAFTYDWSNDGPDTPDDDMQDISNLLAGNYSVTVTDAAGCSAVSIFTVDDVNALGCSLLKTDVLCNEDASGTITVNGTGGTTPYEYSLNGAAWQPGNMFASLTAGTHEVTIRDRNECTSVCSITITEPALLSCSATGTNLTNCIVFDGAVSVVPAGGVTPYEFSIDGGAFQTSPSFTGLMSGGHLITVRDANLCTSNCEVTLTAPNTPMCQVTSIMHNECFEDEEGVVTVIGSGGVAPYEFSIDNTIWQTSGTFDELAAGMYSIYIRNASSSLCVSMCAVEITEPEELTCQLFGNDPMCNGGNDGNITIIAMEGTPGYEFSLNSGPWQPSNSFINLTAGTYTITTRDDNDCLNTCQITLNQPPLLECTTTVVDILCNGDASGQITIAGIGGTGAYDYNINGGFWQDANIFSNLLAGTYTVTIRDENDCLSTCSAVVNEPPALVCNLVELVPESCAFNDGVIEVNATGGTTPVTYSIDGGITTQATGLFEDLTLGIYEITIEDANGCITECEFEILPDCFDLALTKKLVTAGPYAYGQDVVFDIEVINQGNIDAQNIEISEHIPCGFSYDPALLINLAYDWSPLMTANPMATITNIPAQSSVTIQIVLKVEMCTDANGHVNVAEISMASDPDGNPGDDVDSDPDYDPNNDAGGEPGEDSDDQEDGDGTDDEDDHDPALVEIYDNALTKELVTPGPYAYGDLVEFAVEVCNQSSLPVANVEITDHIPGGYSYDVADQSAAWMGAGAPTPADVTFTIPATINGGECVTVPIFLTLEMAGGYGDWENTAEISSFTDEDGDPQDDVDSDEDNDDGDQSEDDEDSAGPEVVDAALTKTTSATGPFSYGDVVPFDITVSNQGNIDLYNVVVNDFIPCGYKYLVANDADWSYDAATGIATTTVAGPIVPGASVTVSKMLEVQPCVPDAGNWTNVAEIESFENEDGEDITDEDIDSDADDDPTNDTTEDDVNDNTNGDEDDNDPETIEVFDLAQIKVITTEAPYAYGDLLEYTITLTNQGNVTATNVTITDHLPAGFSFDAADNIGWDGVTAPAITYLYAGPLAPNATVEIPIFVTLEMTMGGDDNYTNISEISEAQDEDGDPTEDADSDPDSDPTNDGDPDDNETDNPEDEDDHDPEFIEVVDLALVKTTTWTDPIQYGDVIPFEIEVFNQGNVDAYNVDVIDYIPCGYEFVNMNLPEWSYSSASGGPGTLFYEPAFANINIAGPITAGSSATVTIFLMVQPCVDEAADYTNTAEITSFENEDGEDISDDDIDSTADDMLGNDEEEDNVTDNTNGDEDDSDPETPMIFDLALTKSLAASQVTPVSLGDQVTFVITVFNQGKITATNIDVVDYMPAGFGLSAADTNGWVDADGDGNPENTVAGPIAPNGSMTIEIVVDVLAAMSADDYVNVAEITGSMDDMGNDTSDDDIDSEADDNEHNDGGGEVGSDDDDETGEDGNNGNDEDDADPATVPVEFFDLALTKMLAPGQAQQVMPGADVTFIVNIINQGTIDAYNVDIVDYLPADLTLSAADTNGWVDSNADGNPENTIAGPIAAYGGMTSIEIVVTVNPALAAPAELTNVAEISGAEDEDGDAQDDVDSTADDDDSNDPLGDDNQEDGDGTDDEDDSDPAVIEITDEEIFDLALAKTFDPNQVLPVYVGDDVTFLVTVTNQGTVSAQNIEISDYMGASLDYSNNDTNGWVDSDNDGVYENLIPGPVAPGASVTIPIVCTIIAAPNAPEDLLNIAEITAAEDENGDHPDDVDSTPDTDPSNDPMDEDDNDEVEESGADGDDEDDHDWEFVDFGTFDLALTKTLSPTQPMPIMPGGDVTFVVKVYNQGDVDAFNIDVVDYTPEGLTLSTADFNGWVDSDGDGNYENTIAGINAGECLELEIVMTIDADATGSITNYAEIADAEDENGNHPSDTDSTADDDPNNDNEGDDNQTDGDGDDDEDDHDPETITLMSYDLALTKKLAPGQSSFVMAGEDVTFVIEVINQGTLPTANIDIAEYIPAGMTLSTADANGWTDTDGDGVLENMVAGPLLGGMSESINLILTIDADFAGMSLKNYAEISDFEDDMGNHPMDSDSEPDDNPNNDVEGDDNQEDGNGNDDEDDHDPEEVFITNNPVFDLALEKTLDPNTPMPVYPGSDVTFFITVTNQGNQSVQNVAVVDYLPTGLTLSTADMTGWVDVNNDGNPEILINTTMAPGAVITIPITVTIDPDFTGSSLENRAEISDFEDENGDPQDDTDSTPDDDPDNDPEEEDDEDGDVIPLAQFDLALRKTIAPNGAPSPIMPGNDVTFRIEVHNQGNVPAYNVDIAEYIPAGLLYSVNDNHGWVDSNSDGVYENTITGPIPPGDYDFIDIILTVDPNIVPPTSVENEAEISDAEDENGNHPEDSDSDPDSDPDNDGDANDDNIDGDNGDEDDNDIESIDIFENMFDLALRKIVSPEFTGGVQVGEDIPFDIWVFNQGNLVATNIEVTDHMPAGTSLSVNDTNGWTDFDNDNVYEVTLPGPLAPGDSILVELVLTLDTYNDSNELVNYGEISGADDENGDPVTDIDSTPDADNTNDNGGDPYDETNDETGDDGTVDEDDHDPALFTIVDVALVKTTSANGPFSYGDAVTFDIEVTNQGNVDLYNVDVSDFIPCGYTYLASNDTDWTYDSATGIAVATIDGPLVRNASETVSITLEVKQCFEIGAYNNVAEITAMEDEDGEDITDEDIDSDADGDPTNDDTEDNVIDNTNGDEDDNDPEEIEVFDLALIKQLKTPLPYGIGDLLEYEFVVVNQGNVSATNISVVDHLPPGFTYDAADNIGWDDTTAPAYVFTITDVLAPLDTARVSIFVTLQVSAGGAPDYVNTGEISGATDEDGNPREDADSDPDNDPDNDGETEDDSFDDEEDDHDTETVVLVDVALVKTTSTPGPHSYGDVLTFDIEVFNQGVIDLYNVKVNDFLPCGYEYLASNDGTWSHDPLASIATTTVAGPIVGGTSVIVSIDLELIACVPASDDAWTNVAEVESMENMDGEDITDEDVDSDGDNDPTNDPTTNDVIDNKDGDEDDHDPETIEVFDLALMKTTTNTGPYVSLGDTIEYVITVYNQGNVTAEKIGIIDYVQAPLLYDASLNSGWTLIGTDLEYFADGPIAPGGQIDISLFLIIDPLAGPVLEALNFAEIFSVLDDEGNDRTNDDIDSAADNDRNNDIGGEPGGDSDNEILDNGFDADGDGVMDEDDHDPVRLVLLDCHELACIGDINLSLDDDCSSEITAAMLLFDAPNDPSLYEIVITDENGQVVDNMFDFTDIGSIFFVSVSIPDCDDNSCWSAVTVEDKYIPTIDCGGPVLLPCNATEDDYPDPIVMDNCGGAEFVLVNQTITPAECESYLRVIERTFIAVDAQGNESAPCTQIITIDRVNTAGIQFPGNFTSNVCTTSTDPLTTGVPMFEGKPIFPDVPGALCNVFVTFEDIPLGSGACNLSFTRVWRVGEWYCGTTAGLMQWVQLIEVNDLTPPSIACPANITVTTSGGYGVCEATVTLPAATVNDDCNNPVEVVINGGPEVVFGNGGEVMLPVGTTTLTYVAYDGCYNSSTCEMTVTVADETQPTIVCKLNTVVSLQSTGLAEVLAEVFDNGSFDDCQIDRFEAARMDDICNVSGTDFGSSVTFCCEDVGTEVMVRLRVYDSSGNHNECMVAVEVQDKEPATLTCPPNETVECTTPYDINNMSIQFGTYTVDDNCADQLVTETVVEDIDQCGLGTVRRTFTMPDGLGGTLSCTQVISFTNSDPFDGDDPNDLIWPLDLTINGMCTVDDVHPDNLNAPFNFPIITEDACDLVGVNYEDQVFDFVAGEDACFKVLRTWKVVDWCQNVNGTFDTWEHEQIIKVTNNVAPTFVSGCEDQLVETLDCNAATVTLVATGSDDCTTAQGLGYSYTIENLGDGSTVATGNTNDASGSFELGIYEITWILLDGCGNEATCSSTFEIVSNKAPVAYCIQGLSTELIMMDTDGDGIPDTEMVELWASDFDAGSYHPCGYAVTLSFSSDPTNTNIAFDCSQQGQQGVQLWVTDENGNQSFCNTFVVVDDNDNSCPEMLIVDVQGRIFTEVNENVEDVEVDLDGSADQDMTSEVGEYVFEDMPISGAYVIDPGKNDDVMNGVSTLDLVMIQKHLLQLRELDSPYKLIAADINHDEKVTAIDLIQLRKLILGVVEEFPANTSWRFVDALYEFPIPTDPWDEAFPEEYDIPALNTNMSIDFVGVKIGDVNGSVTANVTGDITENRSDKTLSLIYTDRLVQEGEQVIVPLRSSNFEQIAGLQLTLDHKGLILDRVEEGVLEMNSGNIGKLQDAQTTLSWNDRGGIQQTTKSADVLFNLVFTASETGRLSTMLSLSDQVIQTEAYRLLATTEFEEINISLEVEISKTDIIEGYTLHQNEPNPWSRMTAISIESIKDVEGTLTVKDALGKLIVSKDVALVTGFNELVLTKNDIPVGGVYYYTLTIGDVQLSKQMIRME